MPVPSGSSVREGQFIFFFFWRYLLLMRDLVWGFSMLFLSFLFFLFFFFSRDWDEELTADMIFLGAMVSDNVG